MNWLINLVPIVLISIFIIVIMKMLASMIIDEPDKKGKEVEVFNPILIMIGVAVGITVVLIIAGIVIQGGVGVNYHSFGEVDITRKGFIFPSFSYVILAIGVFSAIYLLRRELFKKRSVRIG